MYFNDYFLYFCLMKIIFMYHMYLFASDIYDPKN